MGLGLFFWFLGATRCVTCVTLPYWGGSSTETVLEKVDHSRERLRSRLIERSRISLRVGLPAGAVSRKGRSFAGAAALSPSVFTNG